MVSRSLGAVGRLAVDRERHRPGDLAGQAGAVGVVDVDHGDLRPPFGEQQAFRLEVLLHRAVEVEMVLGEVGEDRHREVDRIGPVELERVGGHLDRAGDVASVEHLPEGSLEVDRLGGGALDRALLATDHALDCPQQPGLASIRLQQRADQERRGGLAVGAGDADRL